MKKLFVIGNSCNGCPFFYAYNTGIFQHWLCTVGLYRNVGIDMEDWRRFTPEEMRAGYEEGEEIRRAPRVIPEWCPLRGEGILVRLEGDV